MELNALSEASMVKKIPGELYLQLLQDYLADAKGTHFELVKEPWRSRQLLMNVGKKLGMMKLEK